MTPKGLLGYIAGVIVLVGAIGLALCTMLYSELQPRGRFLRDEAGILLIVSAILCFGAVHLVSAGLYRMLVHLYYTISRTDPAGDHRLRGRTLFVLGQISSWITVPTTVLFIVVAIAEADRANREIGLVLVFVMPCGLGMIVSLVAWTGGLAIMVRDVFLRHRDIVDKREGERRRRFEEADEPQTEVIPPDQPSPAELRQHVKEDR
jgi:hypothetical protein